MLSTFVAWPGRAIFKSSTDSCSTEEVFEKRSLCSLMPCNSTAADPKYVLANECIACPPGNTCDGDIAQPCDPLRYVNLNECLTCPSNSTCNGTTAEVCVSTNAAVTFLCSFSRYSFDSGLTTRTS